MEKTVESWLNRVLDDGAFQSELLQSQRLDDTFGWGAILSAALQANPSVTGHGLLLTGPDGCGKHTAAAHMMKLLHAEGYDAICLDGSELSCVDFTQAKEYLDGLFDHFYEQGKGLCLCLQEMESCPHRRQLLNYLGQTLYKCQLYPEDLTPVYLILIDTQEDIPQGLRSLLRLCRMGLPDMDRRTAFLATKGKIIRHEVSLTAFAEATEGASYAQLLDMIDNVAGLVDSQGKALTDEELCGFLASQMPPQTQLHTLRALAASTQLLVDKLPKLLKDAAASVRTAAPAKEATTQILPDPAPLPSTTKSREEIENMRVADLAVELFGQEAVDEIINNYQLTQ